MNSDSSDSYEEKRDAQKVLREHNLRVTPQRLMIYEFLLGNDSHPTAENVYAAAREVFPSISLNTVYSNLDVLAGEGLIQKFSIGKEHTFHYDPNPKVHPHFCCKRCGRVVDMDEETCEDLDSLVQRVQHRCRFEVTEVQLHALGLCDECLQKEKDSKS